MEHIVITLDKGVLTDLPVDALPEGYVADVRHVRFGDGKASKMQGYASYYATAAPTYVNGLFVFSTDAGVDYVLRGTQATIYEIHSGVGTALKEDYTGALTDRWSFAPFGNVILFSNGVDSIQKFVSPYTAVAACGGSPPTSKVVRVFQRHAFALGQVTVPRRVSWSDIDDYETWTAAATNEAGDIDLYESKTRVVGGDGLGDFFVVYTQNQIHVFQYVGPPFVFSRRIADWNVGLLNHSLLASVSGAQFFMTPKNGFYGFDGVTAFPISDGNWKYIYSKLNYSYIANSFAFPWVDKNEIWFCVPIDSAQTPSIACIYNYRNNSWAFDDIAWFAGADAIPLSYPLIAEADKKLYSLGSTENKAGAAYNGYVISREYDFGEPEAYKTILKIQPVIESTATSIEFYIQYRNNINESWETSSVFTITPLSTVKLDTRITGRRFRFHIKTNITGSPFSVCRLIVHYDRQGTR